MLHLPAHAPNLVLQPASRPLERVIEREIEILEPLILMGRALDRDLALVWKDEMQVDLIEPARVMMRTRTLHETRQAVARP